MTKVTGVGFRKPVSHYVNTADDHMPKLLNTCFYINLEAEYKTEKKEDDGSWQISWLIMLLRFLL